MLAVHKWIISEIKDGQAKYEEADTTTFNLNWINSIVDKYLTKDPIITTQNKIYRKRMAQT